MRQFKISERFTNRQSKSIGLYLNEMQRSALMTADEEYEVACKAFEGDEAARERLVKANLRFVFTVAKMYSHDPDTLNDIVSAGNIGLIDAAKKFDPHKGFKFISYAVWHIRKEMIDYLAKNSRTIRLPGNRNTIVVKAKEAQNVIYSREGREATDDEILEYVRGSLKETSTLTIKDIAESIAADRKAYSLDQPLSEHGESESTLLDVYDGTVGSEQHVYDEENYRHILKLLTEDLVPREKEVVERIHALNGRLMPQTFTDIAEEWGCQAETVRVVYRKTIRKMQKKARHLRINISSIF